jgi:ATP-dependent Clp protease ATP-binding subunit ClpX
MEDTEVPLHAANDIRSQMQMMFEMRNKHRTGREVVRTRNILFIVSGAFSGMEKQIQKRQAQAAIGFNVESHQRPEQEDLIRQAVTQDFIDYGFEAEFIGRLPVRVFCEPLKTPDFIQIMKRSEGSLLRQYEREFRAYGVHAIFEDAAIQIIAERAAQEKTGARGLVTAWEKVLRDFKFELPSLGLPELRITADLVKNPAAVLHECQREAEILRTDVRADEALTFSYRFNKLHELNLEFTHEAVQALVVRLETEGGSMEALCQRLFKDYSFGLQLISRSTGQSHFIIEAVHVQDPDQHLSQLILQSYGKSEAAAQPATSPFNTSSSV